MLYPDAQSLWCSNCAVCASAGYRQCFGRSLACLCASSLQNFTVNRTFILLAVTLWNNLSDHVFDSVGLGGFKSRSNAFLFALQLTPLLYSTAFHLSSFFLWDGIMGLGTLD